jgi:hypothetical protein
MASQFIHSNNQSLLWKVINNTPQTINYFANAPSGEKEKWFQTVIGHVYNQYNGQNISLRDMNKRSIDFMLQSLAPKTSESLQSASVPYPSLQSAQSQASVHYPSLQSQASVPYPSLQSQASVPYPSLQSQASVPYKTREQQVTDQFTRRQAEYESMIKKETPTPHFIENVKDEAILDLGSAVKEYMKQRNQDSEVNLPPAPAPAPLAQPSTTPLAPAQPSALKLDLKNAEPISLTVDELPSKKVQWGENTEHIFDKNDSIINYSQLEKDILEIKNKMDQILALLQK